MMLLEAKNITKVIDNGVKEYCILNSNFVDINKGEFVSIMGPSGSGKSSLLNIFGGLDHDYTGELYICGQAMHEMKEDQRIKFRREKIGMVFQDFDLIQTLSVSENMKLPLLFARKKQINEKKINTLLNMVGMYDKREETCSHLSGGEKQRVSIARSLILEPELLLADEPTGALDSKNGFNIMELLKMFNEKLNMTIILVTHDVRMASFGNRMIPIEDGRLKIQEEPLV